MSDRHAASALSARTRGSSRPFRSGEDPSVAPRRTGLGARALPGIAATILLVVGLGCTPEKDEAAAPAAMPGDGDGIALDARELERVEDLSESLANDLLDLSVATRRRDVEEMRTYLAEEISATPWPVSRSEVAVPGGGEPGTGDGGNPELGAIQWIGSYRWDVPALASTTGDAFLADWNRFLDRFAEVEDARFKVKGATFASDTGGAARLYFFAIGRNQEGEREAVSAWAQAEAVRRATPGDGPADGGPDPGRGEARSPGPAGDAGGAGEGDGAGLFTRWQLSRFELESVSTLVAEKDLFSEVSRPAGVALQLPRYGAPGNEGFVWHGAAAQDVDRDGDVDLLAAGVDRNYLYLNRGDGTFEEAAERAGVARTPEPAVAPLFLDYDNDGDADLFLSASGPQMLFENRLVPDGALAFRDVSVASGVDLPAIGFSAVAGDVNGDGFPDVLVNSYQRYGVVMPNGWADADNGTPNLLFLNQGDGTFREVAAEWGIADPRWSYAAEFVDLDRDGDLDVYIANDFGTNAVYRNEGGRFVDVAEELGLTDPGNGMGVSFGDYDNDGDLDLHVTNMSSTAGNRILGRLYGEAAPTGQLLRKLAAGNSLYEQEDDGTWRNVTSEVGGFSAGWAWGGGFIDVDNDGWEDTYSPNGFVSGKLMKDT